MMPGSSSGSATSEPRRTRVSRQAQKLSEEKLARKRALDREAQRSSRSKTKNHIALLESRIEALTRIQGNGNTKELIDQIEGHRKENEALRARLKAIGKLIDTGGDGEKASDELYRIPEQHSLPEREKDWEEKVKEVHEELDMGATPDLQNIPTHVHIDPMTSYGVPANEVSPSRSNETMDITMDVTFEPSTPAVPHSCQHQHAVDPEQMFPSILEQPLWSNPVPYTTCNCSKMVNYTKEILGQCSKLQLRGTANQKVRDADIPIRAVLHGWTAVTEKYSLDPLWTALRHADELVFSKCAPMERLVVLRNLTKMLRYRVNPTKQNLDAIPLYLHERPAQRFIPHESLIDYLVWPGLRERFVFSPHRYCSEKCTSLFWKCFRFIWPYTLQDSYTVQATSGLYQYSKVFEEEIRDLGHFRMTPEFLDEFPELRADIGCTVKEEVDERDPYQFENMGESFGMGSLEELELLGQGMMGGEGVFSGM